MTSDSSQPLAGRIALVTGATRGIGEAVALGLAKAGAHVIAVGRTQGALEALDDAILEATGERATLVPLDLREPDGLDHLGAAIHQRWGKLDIVVGAAGLLGPLTPVSHMEPKGWEMILSTNLTANWRLIRAMDPLLRASDAGRALFFSSSVAKTRPAFWGAYAATKAALEAIVDVYADETENTPIRALCRRLPWRGSAERPGGGNHRPVRRRPGPPGPSAAQGRCPLQGPWPGITQH